MNSQKRKQIKEQRNKQKELSFDIWKRLNPSYVYDPSIQYETENSQQFIDYTNDKDKTLYENHRVRDKHSEYREAYTKFKILHNNQKK